MAARRGHYMPPSLLTSQIATLEPPVPDENVLSVDVGGTPEDIVEFVLERLRPAAGA
jgi:gluconokinase